MSIKYDLVGQRFGSLTVTECLGSEEYRPGKHRIIWKCDCDCGNVHILETTKLTSGGVTMCPECAQKLAHEKHRVDYTGKKYGMLTVKSMIYNYKGSNQSRCVCDCECGNTDIIAIPQKLKTGVTWHCGCQRGKSARISMTGKRYGRLLVLEELFDEKPHKVRCLCDCGEIVTLRRNDVLSGHTLSCGCLQKEKAGEANTIDYTGMVSDYGVTIVSRSHKNKFGQWIWNCSCPFCNSIFQDLPARILNGHVKSCGCNTRSGGEIYIESLLNEFGVKYIQQYTFKDCKSDKGYALRFDFAVLNENFDVLFCIEYDGQQHFKPIEYFGGEEGFKNTQRRDQIKNDYCEANEIPLYRIPYYMNNDEIKKYLLNILSLTTAGNAE